MTFYFSSHNTCTQHMIIVTPVPEHLQSAGFKGSQGCGYQKWLGWKGRPTLLWQQRANKESAMTNSGEGAPLTPQTSTTKTGTRRCYNRIYFATTTAKSSYPLLQHQHHHIPTTAALNNIRHAWPGRLRRTDRLHVVYVTRGRLWQ